MADATVASGLVGWIIAAGAVLAALYGMWRYVVRPVARAVALIVQIGGDFLGHDARPGVPRTAGVMERLGSIETQIRVNGTGLPLGDAMARTMKDVDHLKSRADTNAAGIRRLEMGQGDARAAAEKARDLAAEVHSEFHGFVEEGHLREQAYLASLHELGIEVEPQPRRDPHARTREDDDR